MRRDSSGGKRKRHQPVRLLHRLEGLFLQASLTSRSSGVQQRRERQRLALAQRLLDPLPPELSQPGQWGVLFWRGLRWGTVGMAVALWLKR
jgi:hypothetical protein